MTSPYVPYAWADGSAGNTPVTAARLNALEAGVRDAYTYWPPGTTLTVVKSGGVWPTSYTASGTPVYTGGTANGGVRPTSRADIAVIWKGADPSPAIVSSGTGGMLDGSDSRFVTP